MADILLTQKPIQIGNKMMFSTFFFRQFCVTILSLFRRFISDIFVKLFIDLFPRIFSHFCPLFRRDFGSLAGERQLHALGRPQARREEAIRKNQVRVKLIGFEVSEKVVEKSGKCCQPEICVFARPCQWKGGF